MLFKVIKKKKIIKLKMELENITYDNTVIFIPPIKCGKVIKVYDGDTITIACKLFENDSNFYRFSVRIDGVDTPEIKGKTSEEKEKAKIVREALTDLIMNKIVYLENVRFEKYGRILAKVIYNDINISNWLIENNYAHEYQGGKKQEWIFPEI